MGPHTINDSLTTTIETERILGLKHNYHNYAIRASGGKDHILAWHFFANRSAKVGMNFHKCPRACPIFNSDGSGPKKTGSGRARALKVGLGPGPGLSPSLKAGLRAGPGLGPLPT